MNFKVLSYIRSLTLVLLIGVMTNNCASKNTSVTISSENGGAVTSNKGVDSAAQATLTIPADALDQSTAITITTSPKKSAQGEIVPFQVAYNFEPAGLQFNKPATLDICYNPSEITNAGLSENTVQIYYLDPDTGDYASIGGTVNTTTHCVSAQVEHFSTYLPAAQALTTVTNPLPTVGAPTFLPSTPLAGLPLRVRSVITNFATPSVDPVTGAQTSALVAVNLYYRVTGSAAAFTKVPLLPDSLDATGQRYYAVIPAASVTTSGIDYYIETVDNLLRPKTRPLNASSTNFTPRSITASVNALTPLQLNPVSANLNITAGFSRDFTTRAHNAANGAWLNIVADNYSVTGGIGTASAPSISNIRFTSQTTGTGFLNATAGAYSTSQQITVHAGTIYTISLLDNLGVKITNPVDVVTGQTYQFDVLGYDLYGNFVLVNPLFSTTGGIGAIDAAGLFTSANITVPTSGTVVADLAGVTTSAVVNVIPVTNSPVFTPPAGTYTGSQSVAISSTTPGAAICYDASGNVPACNVAKTGCASGTLYTSPVSIVSTTTLNTIACTPGFMNSTINTASYVIKYTIGGTLSGLLNGRTVVLQNNGADDLTLSADGTFTFTTLASYNAAYNVTVKTQPVGQVCTITGGNGTVSDNIFSVNVRCPVFTTTSSMIDARAYHTATLLPNGKILIAGGFNNLWNVLSSAEIYDPLAGTFTITGSMVNTRAQHTATLLPNGKVLVIGGQGTGGLSLLSAELYDPTTGSFTATGSMPYARLGHTATLLPNGKILVTGGFNGSQLPFAELYDPATGTFTPTGSMIYARQIHTATLLPNGNVLIVGGITNGYGYLRTAEIYNTTIGTFLATTGSMTYARGGHTATLLSNGKVLITGSYGAWLASTELYEPATGIFTPSGSMTSSRGDHTATLLSDGKVFITGSYGTWLASTELYDPTTGAFAATSSMVNGRADHTATLMQNGQVLVTGGFNGLTNLSSAELYY